MNTSVQLEWHPERRSVRELKNWKLNPRKITREAFSKLKERITERGFHDVIKIDLDNTVLSGNMRKKALVELGVKEVTVLLPNRPLTDKEKSAVALESNFNDGTWDFSGLKSFEFDLLSDVGFDEFTLGQVFDENLEVDPADEFDVECELKKITEPKTKLGDLIVMGPHKLICGDSTDPKVLQKLFGKERASMIYSDPVYNINYSYKSGLGSKKNYGATVNDKRTDEEYAELLRKSLKAALSVTKKDAHIFYWSDQCYIWLVQTLYRELSIENKRVCMWIKNGFSPTPGVSFNKCYEPCTYGIIGSPHLNENLQNLNEVMNGGTTTGNDLLEQISDIWTMKRLSSSEYEHATSKPPKLHEKAIRRCTRPNDIILDSFSGSASTMIAGEQLKRRVYGVELEPRFCDLAIKRYEKLTGKKAQVIRNGHEEK